jgi:hypothetical protein
MTKAIETAAAEINQDEPQAFILGRARSEVHLLLDNISANPDVTIASLASAAPPADKGLPAKWIEKICEITWPPAAGHGDSDELADEAALLIRAKDYLNGLVKPASGATIAFTLLVTQGDAAQAARRRAGHGAKSPPSRASLAGEAYPDLVEKAARFRRLIARTLVVSAIALVFTLFLSWYLALGNAAIADFAAARAELAAADARAGSAQAAMVEAAGSDAPEGAPGQAAVPPAPSPAQPAARPTPAPPAARPTSAARPPARAGATTAATVPSDAELGAFHLYPCRTDRYTTSDMRDACLARRMAVERWVPVQKGLRNWAFGAEPYTAAWFATLIGSGILPVLYGFLGAIAAVVRTLSRKIKSSTLSPRDAQLTLQQLALGAVVGACISLFIPAPGAGDSGTALLGPVALSASAISFVAGFGVDSVFQALEALISRIFNITPAGMGPRAETRPAA